MRIRHQVFILILCIVVLSLSIVSSVIFVNYANSQKALYEVQRHELEETLMVQHRQHGMQMADAIGEAVINPILLREYKQVDRVLLSFSGQAEIKSIYVYNADYEIISESEEGVPNRGKQIDTILNTSGSSGDVLAILDDSLVITHPIMVEQSLVVGGLSIVMDMSAVKEAIARLEHKMGRLHADTQQQQINFLIYFTPVILGLALLISYLAAKHISRPIDKISEEISRMERKEYDLDLPVTRKDEIGHLSKTIAKLAVIIGENERFKDKIVSSVSHELRTPLTSVRGFATIIRRDLEWLWGKDEQPQTSKGQKKMERVMANLGVIEQEGDRLTRLINSILDLHKLEAGKLVWNMSVVSPDEILSRVLSAIEGLFALNGQLELRVEIPDDLPEIYADADRIEQVVVNLISNAVKYTEEGNITVRAHTVAGNKLRVDVTDTGNGIPEEMREHIFERFQQIHDGQQQPRGTGLGLAISKEIVEQHGGSIWVTDNECAGSCFSFEIPLHAV